MTLRVHSPHCHTVTASGHGALLILQNWNPAQRAAAPPHSLQPLTATTPPLSLSTGPLLSAASSPRDDSWCCWPRVDVEELPAGVRVCSSCAVVTGSCPSACSRGSSTLQRVSGSPSFRKLKDAPLRAPFCVPFHLAVDRGVASASCPREWCCHEHSCAEISSNPPCQFFCENAQWRHF